MSTLHLSPLDALRATLTFQLAEGVMEGHVSRGYDPDSAQRKASYCLDECSKIANSLIGYEADLPGGHQPERVLGVGRLFSRAVSGLVAQGKAGDEALRSVNVQRDRLFRTAQSVISGLNETSQLEATREARAEVTLTLMSGVLDGYLNRHLPVADALQLTGKTNELCRRMANTIVGMDQDLSQPEQSVSRLKGVGQLFARAVAGLMGRGEEADAALHATARQRDRFFVVAQQILDKVLEQAPVTAPADMAEQRLRAMEARRQSSPVMPNANPSGPRFS